MTRLRRLRLVAAAAVLAVASAGCAARWAARQGNDASAHHNPDFCTVMHADGAGTKSSLAYIYWKETGDLSVWKGIAQDAIIMNIDDLLCVGATENILLSSTIGRNKTLIPGEVIAAIIDGTEEVLEMLRHFGLQIISTGGETADLGDLVRTIVVDSTVVCRMKRSHVIENSRIKEGNVIVGLSSYGQAIYETAYNGGMGSNGLTSSRHDTFHNSYASKYPAFSRKSGLNLAQRYHFIAGWLPWFGDAISLVMNVLCIFWSLGMALFPKYFGAPLYILMLPPIGAFLFKLLHFLWLYTVRVPCTFKQRLGAALAGTALTHTIATTILRGIFTTTMPFLRTPKCESKSAVVKGLVMARGEALMLAMLLVAVVINYNCGNDQTEERLVRAALLLIQALPYAAALQDDLRAQGAVGALMSGSGASVFGLFPDAAASCRAAAALP